MVQIKENYKIASKHFEYSGTIGVIRFIIALFQNKFSLFFTEKFGFSKRVCPCCKWEGKRFLPFFDMGYVAFDSRCPKCQSQSRHRGHIFLYEKLFDDNNLGGNLLYIAPEKNISFFQKFKNIDLKTSEYNIEEKADFHYDLVNIDCNDNEWDYIICHRVIEHLHDDKKGMAELFRVLKPNGICILSVPISSNLEKTIEYGKPNEMESYHYYNYGKDFIERIPKENMKIEELYFSKMFTKDQFKKYSLDKDFIYVCRKNLN